MIFEPKAVATLKVTSIVLLGISLLSLGYWLFNAYFPSSAEFAMEARTDRLVLEVRAGGPRFAWTGLELVSTDGRASGCVTKPIQFGDENVLVTLTVARHPTYSAATSRMEAKTDSEIADLNIYLRRHGASKDQSPVICVGKAEEITGDSMSLVLRGERGRTYHLPVYARVIAGGIVDPQGGVMTLMRGGTLRASARLKGASQIPVSNQVDLRPGDQVEVPPPSAGEDELAIGVAIFDGKELEVFTHSKGATAVLRRAGLGVAEALHLKPSPIAILQSNPVWGVVTLGCSIVSGLLGLLALRSRKAACEAPVAESTSRTGQVGSSA
jgi:hypothetical protein